MFSILVRRISSWNLKRIDLVFKVTVKASAGRPGMFWPCILFEVT